MSASNDAEGQARGSLRPVRPLPAATEITPAVIPADLPELTWCDPTTLFVEAEYQRSLSEKSISLIRRIVEGWSWAAMKPPICARIAVDGSDVLAVIDGQHTAIAAATHPGIDRIPVLIVPAGVLASRAMAALRHNRDRINWTPLQVHHAAVAAGDEYAVALDDALRRAGARILRNPMAQRDCKVGDTMAAGALATLVRARGVVFTAKVLRVLVDALRAPIPAVEIAAVAQLLTEPEWRDSFEPADLATVIRSKAPEQWLAYVESNVRKGQKMPTARAYAIALFRLVRKKM